MDVAAQALHRRLEDLPVVEGQLRQGIDREPCGFRGVVAADNLCGLDERVEGNGDHALARVAVRVGEDAQLAHGRGLEAGLLPELPQGAFFRGLPHLQEAARERPAALVGLAAAPHQQDLQLTVFIGKDDAVGGHGHVLVLVLVREFSAFDVCEILSHRNAKIGVFRGFANFCVDLTHFIWKCRFFVLLLRHNDTINT